MSDAPSVIVTTREELEQLITAAVEKALAEQREDVAPALLDRATIARRLGIGTSTVDRLRREGMPVVWIGESPRFEADACVAWLRDHSQQRPGADE